jgi:hypothetical protein
MKDHDVKTMKDHDVKTMKDHDVKTMMYAEVLEHAQSSFIYTCIF